MFDADAFFRAVIEQNAEALRAFFHQDAWVDWLCTSERFTVDEYIRANCEYPGDWWKEKEKCVWTQDGCVLAAKVWPKDESASFHVVSFVQIAQGKITSMEEYWSDDGPAPEWRRKMNIGRPIGNKFWKEEHQQ